MSSWIRPIGFVITAAVAVYSGHANAAGPASPETSAGKTKGASGEIKVLDESTDPFASSETAPAASKVDGQSVQATQINVSDSGTVEIHVNDANLVEVLRMLSLQSQKNIIASKEVRGSVTANLYDVTVREALDAVLHANGYAYREKGNFIYVYSGKEIADMEKAERKQQTEIFRLYYTPAANAVNMIKPVLSAEAQVSFTTPAVSGIDTGTKDLGGNSHATEDVIVITDYPDKLELVKKIIKEVDRRPQQILVEATILRAALTDDNALGVDFNVVGGVDFNSFTTSSSGQITNAGITPAATPVHSIGTGNSFSNSVQGGMKVGVVTNNVSVFVSALEAVTDTVVLANPKVLALNKQKGEVIVGRKDGYLTTTVTETAQTQTVEFLDTGTRLVFRPYIADDGFVRMEIHPEDSSGGLTSANLPFKITTEVTCNVMVKDGRTIVIGGLFREASDISRNQVPFFGNLPLAGALFRQQRDHTQREEIIIMLTPHIVKDESLYADVSEEQMKKINDLRVGVRKGMMFFGRERMAEGAYENAVAEMNKPKPDTKLALWHLNIATNLNPKFIEAIEMKEKLSGKTITSVDNSFIRDFAKKLIAAERKGRPMVTEAPATQPVDLPVAGHSSTQPVAIANTPATQPAHVAAASTQPSELPLAVEPTTQPAAVAIDPVAQPVEVVTPSTQPVAVELPATQPAQTSVEVLGDEWTGITTVPATQPAAVMVTELPVEPIEDPAK